METKFEKQDDHGLLEAKSQLNSIVEMVRYLKEKHDDVDDVEACRQTILENALSVTVRSGWYEPGGDNSPEEFEILLSTGGPACRIVGDLDEHLSPKNPRVQFQGWGTPWTNLPIYSDDTEADLLTFCEQFYFGGVIPIKTGDC